jgi:hypothetical protein
MPRSWQRRRATGSVMFEYNYGDRKITHLSEYTDFKVGKLHLHDRPGLVVTCTSSRSPKSER